MKIFELKENVDALLQRFDATRNRTLEICRPLRVEDYVVQPTQEVSPPKWHLAHTTWFFEVFILKAYDPSYRLFNEHFPYLFNSYYIAAGERWDRDVRGSLSRPSVQEILDYRAHVDEAMRVFIRNTNINPECLHVFEVGIHHEQQHQELLIYDIKYILGQNPLFPVYKESGQQTKGSKPGQQWLSVAEGVYEIGHEGLGYCFDNELGIHSQYLHEFEVSSSLVTNGEYLEYLQSGAYGHHGQWLSEGWDWVQSEKVKHPLYWVEKNGQWFQYTLSGLQELDLDDPVSHVSFYEADAYARWRGFRLLTEFEWEVAARKYAPEISKVDNFFESDHFDAVQTGGFDFLGNLWEWTASAYRPYPFYEAPDGVLGEYNGKFMVNQMVLRGGSYATPRNHIRHTYRNFFHPHLGWMSSGIRLARHTK